MILKSTLRETIQEVLSDHDIDDGDLLDDLLDRLTTAVPMFDDDEEDLEEEVAAEDA